MRAVRALTAGFGGSADQPWLPGLPHGVAAMATWFVFGAQACITGILLATLASFIVYLPVTALTLNKGQAITPGTPAPALTATARATLLGLWTVTAWAGAALTCLGN